MTADKEKIMKQAARVFLVFLVLAPAAIADVSNPEPTKKPDKRFDGLPEAKQTVLGLYLTPEQAHERWKADPMKTVVLDVRDPAEYVFVGHAPMAYNVPFAFFNPDVYPKDGKPVMTPNPDFIASVKKVASPDETLLVMCRSGERGAKACDALAKAGYTKVYHIFDGFEGDEIKDPQDVNNGKRMKNGWRNAGLPWTYRMNRPLLYLPEKTAK
ncbi:MAG TPA: sulfurtransferase [Planctomycetaceae bacterium]|nr:sulfurtransferase [Planctomycetaceae bacterium]